MKYNQAIVRRLIKERGFCLDIHSLTCNQDCPLFSGDENSYCLVTKSEDLEEAIDYLKGLLLETKVLKVLEELK